MSPKNKNENIALSARRMLSRFLKISEEMIKPDLLLRDDLGVDSVDIWEIICKMEEEFSIKVEEDEIIAINSFQDMVKFIEEKIKVKNVKKG